MRFRGTVVTIQLTDCYPLCSPPRSSAYNSFGGMRSIARGLRLREPVVRQPAPELSP